MRKQIRPNPRSFQPAKRRRWLLALVFILLLAALACSATDGLNLPFLQGGDLQSAVETSVYATRQVSELQTAAAGGGGAAAESTPEPTTDPALSCPAAPAPPDFSTVSLPEGLGELEQQGDQWLLNGTPVELVNHLNADCSATLWVSIEGQTDWPLLVQDADGNWDLGVSFWTGRVALVNTNETDLTVSLQPLDIAGADASDPQTQVLTAYEIYEFATLPPGRYAFSFTFVGDEAFDLSCTLDVQPDSRYSFVAIPIGMAVFEASIVTPSAADVDVTTSSLCTN